MRISQISERTGIPARLLRYYEEQGLLAPARGRLAERGVATVSSALVAAIDPSLVTAFPINLQVDLDGPTRGRTIGDVTRLNEPWKNSRVALAVDVERFLADRAIEKLREYAADWKDSKQPFCLDVHFFGPHLPYFLPDEWFDLIDPNDVELPENFGDSLIGKPPIQENYATYWSTSSFTNEQWKKLIAVYWGYTAMIDFEIGRIMDVARELGILDDTAVFFCADHGEFTGSHRLNDKGPMMYDDIYNVPFIAHIPGVSTVGRSDAFVSLIDLPATVLDIAGLDTSLVEDGRSIVDLTRGGQVEGWREDIVCEFHGHHFPLQQRMLRTRDFKLVINPESINELYDLRLDPAEMNNVYTVPVYDEIRRELATNLYLQLRERGDHSFAKWMAAMTDFDIPLVNTARSDLDEVTSD